MVAGQPGLLDGDERVQPRYDYVRQRDGCWPIRRKRSFTGWHLPLGHQLSYTPAIRLQLSHEADQLPWYRQ